MVKDIKILPEFYEAVLCGSKTFEIRNNDRDYKVGDIVRLNEFKRSTGYTGRCIEKVITYITDYEQKEGYVVFSISDI